MLFPDEKLLIKELHTITRISESMYLNFKKNKNKSKQLTLTLSFRDEFENSVFTL